jgi:hypothetical protein
MISRVGKRGRSCVPLNFIDEKIDRTDFKHATGVKVRKWTREGLQPGVSNVLDQKDTINQSEHGNKAKVPVNRFMFHCRFPLPSYNVRRRLQSLTMMSQFQRPLTMIWEIRHQCAHIAQLWSHKKENSKVSTSQYDRASWSQYSICDCRERGGLCFVFCQESPFASIQCLLAEVVSEICGALGFQELYMIGRSRNSSSTSDSSHPSSLEW